SATALELLEKRNAASKGKAEQAKLEASQQDAATIAAIGDADKAKTDDADKGGADAEASKTTREGVGMNSLLDLNLIKTDIDRVYPIIYYTLK
ncbi:hypothetical protein, partial [Pectobacterium sp. B1J-3]|uniref:hypothetical protein n=1 Tax=Pectobacterium sp. B1J-3 TaxID=3385371 RepID=UPI00390603AF